MQTHSQHVAQCVLSLYAHRAKPLASPADDGPSNKRSVKTASRQEADPLPLNFCPRFHSIVVDVSHLSLPNPLHVDQNTHRQLLETALGEAFAVAGAAGGVGAAGVVVTCPVDSGNTLPKLVTRSTNHKENGDQHYQEASENIYINERLDMPGFKGVSRSGQPADKMETQWETNGQPAVKALLSTT